MSGHSGSERGRLIVKAECEGGEREREGGTELLPKVAKAKRPVANGSKREDRGRGRNPSNYSHAQKSGGK